MVHTQEDSLVNGMQPEERKEVENEGREGEEEKKGRKRKKVSKKERRKKKRKKKEFSNSDLATYRLHSVQMCDTTKRFM